MALFDVSGQFGVAERHLIIVCSLLEDWVSFPALSLLWIVDQLLLVRKVGLVDVNIGFLNKQPFKLSMLIPIESVHSVRRQVVKCTGVNLHLGWLLLEIYWARHKLCFASLYIEGHDLDFII